MTRCGHKGSNLDQRVDLLQSASVAEAPAGQPIASATGNSSSGTISGRDAGPDQPVHIYDNSDDDFRPVRGAFRAVLYSAPVYAVIGLLIYLLLWR